MSNNKTSIDAAATSLRAAKTDLLSTISDKQFRKAVSYAIKGSGNNYGSEFRGQLLILLGGPTSTCLRAALAIELVHAASLVVDDIIDGTGHRRGELSTWKKFGKSNSILLAHYLCSRSMAELVGGPPSHTSLLAKAICEMTTAEFFPSASADNTETYIRTMKKKTGTLVSTAVLLSRHEVELDPMVLEAFDFLGVLHQLEDDRLDQKSDQLSRTRHGRRNSMSLMDDDNAQLEAWRRISLARLAPKLAQFLANEPECDGVMKLVKSFASLSEKETATLEQSIIDERRRKEHRLVLLK